MNIQTPTTEELEAIYRKEPRRFSITETAKIIRAELKKAFPETKFSVRSSVYSMGCNVNVGYLDGPPTEAVESITDSFCGTGFDSMNDSTTHHDCDYQGERVHFAGSRPSVSRRITNQAEYMKRVEAALQTYKLENPYNYSYEWMVLSSMDLRWETPERAVARFIQSDIRAR